MEDINRQDLIKLFQNYVGMYPKDVNCQNWNEMQQKLADEVLKLSIPKEKDIPKGKDFEILTCLGKGEIKPHEYYDGKEPHASQSCIEHGCKIHSVKRLSDNFIIAVKDLIEFNFCNRLVIGTVNHFAYCNGIIDIYLSEDIGTCYRLNKTHPDMSDGILEKIHPFKPKVSLFTTEKKEPIFEDDVYYFMYDGKWPTHPYGPDWCHANIGVNKGDRKFKTKEDMTEYILLNKPIEVSYKEWLDFIDKQECNSYYELTKQFFQSKINP